MGTTIESSWENEQLKAELESMRNVCAEAYQFAGAYNAPVEVMDNLSAAMLGEPLPHETFLPVVPPVPEEITKLRADLAAARAEIEKLVSENTVFAKNLRGKHSVTGATYEHLLRQLAARDLVIKQMREALSIAMVGGDYLPTERSQLNKVLALQPTTEALDEFVQRAVEQERDTYATMCKTIADSFYDDCMESHAGGAWECEAAIRGRGK